MIHYLKTRILLFYDEIYITTQAHKKLSSTEYIESHDTQYIGISAITSEYEE